MCFLDIFAFLLRFFKEKICKNTQKDDFKQLAKHPFAGQIHIIKGLPIFNLFLISHVKTKTTLFILWVINQSMKNGSISLFLTTKRPPGLWETNQKNQFNKLIYLLYNKLNWCLNLVEVYVFEKCLFFTIYFGHCNDC